MKLDWTKNAKASFKRLKAEKRERIMQACIDEFSEEGFDTASTNRIAERAGIAKGSIFKYFGTKEKMFFAVAEYLVEGYIDRMNEKLAGKPKDIVDMYVEVVDDVYSFFGHDVKMFRLFKRIMMENSGEVIKKLREKFEPQIVPMMMEFFKHADTSKIGLTAPELMQVMKWIDTAVDVEAMSEITSKTTAEDLREIYKKKMELVRKLLKHGIYK